VEAALLRVYVNTGMASELWTRYHDVLLGRFPQRPFPIRAARRQSIYWQATEQKLTNLTRFLLRLEPFRLENAPGGSAYLTQDPEVLQRGKTVFAENCAQCHSSKQPPAGADPEAWFCAEVLKDDFRNGNFLSDDHRYPVTIIKSNPARAFASNAQRGHIWQNFSSETYKRLPDVEPVVVKDLWTGGERTLPVPGQGRGYYRTPSLAGVWSSAPFLHNNALGKFTGDPSLQGRLDAFNDAITKLLWPERRANQQSIWRTAHPCTLRLPSAALPPELRQRLEPFLDQDGFFEIGPIPPGTPVNLFANVNTAAPPDQLAALCLQLKSAFQDIQQKHLELPAATELLSAQTGDLLMSLNTCPDFIDDEGHYFGTGLPDPDKRALIEFLKTL
jgi:hypothetical protein